MTDVYRKRTHIPVTQFPDTCFLSGSFTSLLVTFGHVSECFGWTGDRSSSCAPLREECTINTEGDARLRVGQEPFGCEGRRAAAFRRLPARLPGLPAVQEAAEVRGQDQRADQRGAWYRLSHRRRHPQHDPSGSQTPAERRRYLDHTSARVETPSADPSKQT